MMTHLAVAVSAILQTTFDSRCPDLMLNLPHLESSEFDQEAACLDKAISYFTATATTVAKGVAKGVIYFNA